MKEIKKKDKTCEVKGYVTGAQILMDSTTCSYSRKKERKKKYYTKEDKKPWGHAPNTLPYQ